MTHANYSDAISLPLLIRLTPNLVVALFRLMKLLPAKYMIETALADGRLQPGHPVVETSSGTYALGLGIVCAENKLPFAIFSDPGIDGPLRRRLEDLGGTVHLVGRSSSAGNIQTLRLTALKEYLATHPGAYWTRQYDNPENQESYKPVAEQITTHVDGPITLVGTVGSGGSTCGCAKQLRRLGRDPHLVGVDTFGSVLFGLPLGKRMLRGLGNALLPKNLDQSCFDEVHWVDAKNAFLRTRELHARHGIYYGPTSGAAFMVAQWLSRRDPERTVVFIAPDEGFRYQATVYDDRWLAEMGIHDRQVTDAPRKIGHLDQAAPPWCYLDWKRRRLDAVHHGEGVAS